MRTIHRSLVLGALVLPACATSPEELGHTEQSIIGGQTANPADFPTVVGLEESPGNWFCTGTLITKDWILTAAHCVEGTAPASIKIRFDDPDINDAAGGMVVAVSEVHSHPGFSLDQMVWDDDIALLKLAAPVTDREPTPIYREVVPAATAVLDVGYGVADNNEMGGGLLRKVSKVTADCAGANDPGVLGANLVCMDASDGRGSCFGDSGGPTFATINGMQVVAGVTSGGTGEQCGAGWDLYTSIQAELAFIDMVMTGKPADPPPMDPPPGDETPPPADDGADSGDGGCSTGHSSGLAMIGFALMFARRRRQT